MASCVCQQQKSQKARLAKLLPLMSFLSTAPKEPECLLMSTLVLPSLAPPKTRLRLPVLNMVKLGQSLNQSEWCHSP